MSAYSGPVVDVDVHHSLVDDRDIADYLPAEWRHIVRPGFSMTPPMNVDGVLRVGSFLRGDTVTDKGGPGGSDYETMRRQLLDGGNFATYRALLTHQLGEYGCHPNQYLSRVLARAANDWTVDAWLARDERLFSCVVIPLAEPEEAAKEIRRLAVHPQMCGVLMTGNPLGRPIGDPLFHPIFAAAAECDLAVVAHLPTCVQPTMGSVAAGGRYAYMGALTLHSQQAVHYLSSLIVHGVFERFPTLRVLLLEYAIGWIPSVLYRMDDAVDMLRAESPWVKDLPSEYMRRHVKFSTQPLEESFDDHSALFDMLRTFDGIEDLLCFSSDSAHNAMDEPSYVARRLPEEWREKIMHRNATEMLRLPIHDTAGVWGWFDSGA
jgi:uncharacterized protein